MHDWNLKMYEPFDFEHELDELPALLGATRHDQLFAVFIFILGPNHPAYKPFWSLEQQRQNAGLQGLSSLELVVGLL